ncbi:HD-GYP domain-containing protein [Deinococcus sedimenti]|uniref:HD-GYP domain-containing protein n=1 Tax=Deinococcus sedimenti TaxID=1867090 RepID=A0ABQ2S692_9DEIO|nr:HD-GYP domain-containing protein [Deinococcus sedimenti]GGS01131.1 hypothetical protein GCM10008960_29740 [Deinococcus sedimenti]
MSDVLPLSAGPAPGEDARLQELQLYAAQLERYAEEFGTLFHRYKLREAELEAATLAVVNAFVVALGAHDAYTREHTQRVQRSALLIAQTLGWSAAQLEEVRLGAVLHDIGKTSISDTVLCKPGRLDASEYRDIQRHPVIGAHMISGFPALAPARPYVLYHHERFDGRGYPEGLRGQDIPIQGRLLAVADAVDAMLTSRPYRPPLPLDHVMQELRAGMGSQFDPDLVEAFLRSGALDLYQLPDKAAPAAAADAAPDPAELSTLGGA